MRVTQRLYFAALPSVVGALAVAALAYWGQYSRAVPEVILVIAIVATVATLIVSWINVRYVAQRVERLAQRGRRGATATGARNGASVGSADETQQDELDAIEGVVTNLKDAVQAVTDDRARDIAHHEARRRQFAEVLAMVASTGARELDEVQLPLHILLENHFGELNENQEEMLGAARVAAERMAIEITAMAELARIELGELVFRRDRVFPADILNAILPVVRAATVAREIELNVDILPLVPAFHVDASRLQQALQLLLTESVKSMSTRVRAKLSLAVEQNRVVIALSPVAELLTSTQALLARRTIETMHGRVEVTAGSLRIAIKS